MQMHVRISSISKPQKILRPSNLPDLILELGESGRSARRAGSQEYFVEEFKLRRSCQPLQRGQGRHGRWRAALQERQSHVAKQAAVFCDVVVLVFRGKSRGLREQRDGKQQQYENPPPDVISARYVLRNRHTISYI
jgi:hypothetical protein